MASLAIIECPAFLQCYSAIPDIEMRITCIQPMLDTYEKMATACRENCPEEADKYRAQCEEISTYIRALKVAAAAKAWCIPVFQPSDDLQQMLGGGLPGINKEEEEEADGLIGGDLATKELPKVTPSDGNTKSTTSVSDQGNSHVKSRMGIFDNILDRNPHQKKLRAMSVDICTKCLLYGGPEYPTNVFADNNEVPLVPLLRHWIQSMEASQGPGNFFDATESLNGLKGEEFFVQATLLHGALAWKYSISTCETRQRFVSLLDEVCDPTNGPWNDVKNAVFLVSCCVASVKDSIIYMGAQNIDPLFVLNEEKMSRFSEDTEKLNSTYNTDTKAWNDKFSAFVEAAAKNGHDVKFDADVDAYNDELEQLTESYKSAVTVSQQEQRTFQKEFSANIAARGSSTVNFQQTQSIVEKHMNTICSSILQIEAAMRSCGELATLAALQLPNAPSTSTPSSVLRQDHARFLGRHPTYTTFQELFELPPSHMPGCEGLTVNGKPDGPPCMRKSHLYFWGWDNSRNALLQHLDSDIQGFLSFQLDNMANVSKNYNVQPHLAKQVVVLNFKQRLYVQPFIMWLLHVSRRFAPSFHARMRSILPSDTDYTTQNKSTVTIPSASCYHEASLKGLQRCMEKSNDDYHFLDGNAMPTGARLLDVVRGLVVSPSVAHLVECYNRICQSFTVLRIKNGFAEEDPKYGFRQILMNVEMPGEIGSMEEGSVMVVEVQLNLASYVKVKHTIHRFYSVLRCTNEEDLDGVVKKITNAF